MSKKINPNINGALLECFVACACEIVLRLQVSRAVYVRARRRVSATMRGVGHGAGDWGHNLEGGFGGTASPQCGRWTPFS